MASAIVHLAEVTESYAFPESTELNVVFNETSQNTPTNSVSIDKAIIISEVEDKSLKPLCQNTTEHSDSNPHIETTNSREDKDKENVSTNNYPTNVVRRKFRNIVDSDSEEEDTFPISVMNKSYFEQESVGGLSESDEKNDFETSHSVAESKKSRRFIDSDSDENENPIINSINDDGENNRNDGITEPLTKKPLKSKFRTIVDSDSTDSDEPKDPSSVTPINGNYMINGSKETNVAKKQNKQKISAIIDSESEDEHLALVLKNKEPPSNRKRKSKVAKSHPNKSKISTLIDTDSEDDHKSNSTEALRVNEQEGNDHWLTAKKNEKRRTGSLRASKDEAMRQIHSETQRLIRSSQISLPYHRPKQRSLQDFLNRKTHILTLPEGLTTAAKVRMSSEIVGKILEEKEKEAELFYKSSDSEDETITSGTRESVTAGEDTTTSGTLMKEISIEETQKIIKNNVQDSHNKKDIIQQGAVDIGVPRKLFLDEPVDLLEGNESADKIIITDDKDFGGADLWKRVKETKDGLREGSVPRKLFALRSDEEIDMGEKNDDIATIVSSDNANEETCKDTERESDSVDEGIHLSTKNVEFSQSSGVDAHDFTLKLPDSGLQDSCDELDVRACGKSVKPTVESFNLSETPFVSNKEYAKLNKREKLSKKNDDCDVASHVDKESDETVVHHVFGLPPPDTDALETNHLRTKKSSIKKEVLSKLSNVCPRLRGTPGMIIDLSEDVRPDKEGVKSLVDRFLRHSTVKKPTSINMPYTIHHIKKTAVGIEVVEEVIPNTIVLNDDLSNTELQKPGAKHAKLRNELKQKMAMKRGEEWKLKEQKQKDENNKELEEESDYEDKLQLLDEEFEGSTESEPELEDMPREKKKKQKRREFADEEAEVSGDEDEGADEEDEDEEDGDEDAEDETSVISNNDSDTGDDISNDEEPTAAKTKPPSRIIKAFEDDSNSLPDETQERDIKRDGKALERADTDVDMFAPENDDDWLSDTEAEFPPSQILPRDQADARSQLCKTPLSAVNILRFVSPITQLTALNSCTDSPKGGLASNDVSHESRRITGFSEEHTPTAIKESPIVCDSDKRIGFQKKLFEDPAGTVNDDELMDLCSGKFTGIESGDRLSLDTLGNLSSEKITDSRLIGLCSGSFASQEPSEDKLENNENHNVDEASQDIRLTLDDEAETPLDVVASKETKIATTTSRKFKIVSSSDDESGNELENEGKKKIFTKKKIQKLDLSDNESEDDENKYVDYDSEENEVIVPKHDLKKHAAEFLEAEAELSESEWGSADEDEKDLDKLEIEDGDDEEFDENQMRDQVGKLHMRQVQDDDQREVRMLQELLFDDGDLHTDGSGRQRQFKWKNIDNLGEDGNLDLNKTLGDDNEDPIEGDEFDWCKERIERAKFLEEKKKLSIAEGNDELADDTQVFKLRMKDLKESKTSQKEFEPSITKPVVPRTVLDLMHSPTLGPKNVHKAVKRGSFLARGDECLARLAVHIKQSESTVLPRTNPGQFLFRQVTPSVQDETDNETNNLSKEESPTDVKGKKRKPAGGITPRSTKKPKMEITRSRKNKLS